MRLSLREHAADFLHHEATPDRYLRHHRKRRTRRSTAAHSLEIVRTIPGRAASELLVTAIREMLEEAKVSFGSLNAIGVIHGPGSFTGVRVGVAAAKGLCEALHIPVIAVSRLAVLAHAALAHGVSPNSHIAALMDAGRGEFYCGQYLSGACDDEALMTRDQVLAVIRSSNAMTVVFERDLHTSLEGSARLLHLAEPDLNAALPLFLERATSGAYDDIATLDANYVRRTDAEIFAKPGHTVASSFHPTPRSASHLRPATPLNVQAILDLDRATPGAPHWSHATYAQALMNPEAAKTEASERCLFVVQQAAAIVGFGAASLLRESEASAHAELETVVVAKHAQRLGLGRSLCAAMIDWARSCGASAMHLEVRAQSAGAIALYTHLGFRPIGRRPRYYRDPEDDAILMRLGIAP